MEQERLLTIGHLRNGLNLIFPAEVFQKDLLRGREWGLIGR